MKICVIILRLDKFTCRRSRDVSTIAIQMRLMLLFNARKSHCKGILISDVLADERKTTRFATRFLLRSTRASHRSRFGKEADTYKFGPFTADFVR
jgi:hypothetical protein